MFFMSFFKSLTTVNDFNRITPYRLKGIKPFHSLPVENVTSNFTNCFLHQPPTNFKTDKHIFIVYFSINFNSIF